MDDDISAPARPRRHLLAALWALCIGIVVLDRVTKALALAHLTENTPVPVVGELVQLRLIFNPGAAFSIGTGLTWVLTVVAVTVVVAVVRISRRLGSRAWAVALGLLLGGAIGNLIDRLTRPPGFARGHVVDFLALPNFPVFNVADSAITCAAVLIVVLGLRGIGIDGRREGSRPEARAQEAPDA
jgi:signal peptidase II